MGACDDERSERKAKETERDVETVKRPEGKANGNGHEEEKGWPKPKDPMQIVHWAWRSS
jgi:hypothetical protein